MRQNKDELTRTLGRLEGQIAFEERRAKSLQKTGDQTVTLSLGELDRLSKEVEQDARAAEQTQELAELRTIVSRLVSQVKDFVTQKRQVVTEIDSEQREAEAELERLRREQTEAEKKRDACAAEEDKLNERYAALKKEIDEAKDESREAERAVFAIMTKQNELRAKLSELSHREDQVMRDERAFEAELQEGSVLIGSIVLGYKKHEVRDGKGEPVSDEDIADEARTRQEERRKDIERIKIKLEEFGAGSGEEVMKEYRDVVERDEFLEREITDLEKSAESLRQIIKDLEQKLDSQFKEGIVKINKEFQNFFALMFGGGTAALAVVREARRKRSTADELLEGALEEEPAEDEIEEGIEVQVNLPRKKIRGLEMLSGGERALTSIALLFAMSQVNPPPFLILDETDAALDEANSKRYGDMIENLAKHSQLILITHNRETMKRAGVLYGVTMGRDGISKLLSVQFEEAVAVAK